MKVCVATTAFPRWQGDAQAVFVWEAVKAIARQGVDMRVVAMHSPGAATYEVMEGIPIYRPRYAWPETLEALRKGGAGGLPATFEQYPTTRLLVPPFLLAHALAIGRHARGCDLVHAHWTISGALAVLARMVHKAPVAMTVHGSDIYRLPRLPGGHAFTRWTLGHVTLASAVSGSLRQTAIHLGADPERMEVISNGVNTERFPPGSEHREEIILYVGSFIERKGLCHLLRSLPLVLGDCPGTRLVLIGEGPQKAELAQLSVTLGIDRHVTFLPFAPQSEVAQWMQRARLLVLPSTEEGQGVVLLEALSSATPIVASGVGGIPDVVTPDVGILVPPANPEALGKGIAALMRDRARWLAASRAARARAVGTYAWDRIASRFVAMYERAMESGRHPSGIRAI